MWADVCKALRESLPGGKKMANEWVCFYWAARQNLCRHMFQLTQGDTRAYPLLSGKTRTTICGHFRTVAQQTNNMFST